MAGEQLNKESKDLEEFQILMDWMEQQGKKETAQDLLQVAKYLEEMQTQLSVMTKELQEVKQQLSQFQQEQPRQQVAETIQEVSNLQNMITNISSSPSPAVTCTPAPSTRTSPWAGSRAREAACCWTSARTRWTWSPG